MDLDKLLNIIKQGESEKVEFKSSLSLRNEIGATISAFANTKGGIVLIGLSNVGKVSGLDISKKTVEDLANFIKENTDPPIYPNISIHQINSKKVIGLAIKESDEKPVFFKTHGFQRVGKTNQRISAGKIRELAQQQKRLLYWDERICEESTLEEIDQKKVEWYLTRREEMRRVKKPTAMDLKTFLINIKAASKIDDEVKPTNGGALFFAKNPQRFILQSQLRLARFAGKSLARDFLDRRDCLGALWEIVEQAEDFIKKNIRLFGFRTGFTFKRIDKLEYPLKAIREGIINALIHRNYAEPADTRVLIFDDRIEIVNPGSFPKGVTPKKPRHVPVNPILCQLMYDVGFIEKYGTGIYMMKELCEEYKVPKPEYEMGVRETKLIFKPGGRAVMLSEIEKLGIELNQREKKALHHAFREGLITNEIYREVNRVSNKTANLELKDLAEKGLLKVSGKGRATKYLPIS